MAGDPWIATSPAKHYPVLGFEGHLRDRCAIVDRAILVPGEPAKAGLELDGLRGGRGIYKNDAVLKIPAPYPLAPRGGRRLRKRPPDLVAARGDPRTPSVL